MDRAILYGDDGSPLGLGNPVVVGSQVSLTVDSSFAGNDLATLAGSIPSGAKAFLFAVETNDIRVSFDGSDPTSNGFKYTKDSGLYTIDIGDLTKVFMVGQGGTATVRCQFIK